MARVINIPPLSGGDRKFHARQLARGRAAHARLADELAESMDKTCRLACDEWTARQFIGGPVDPSPTIKAALRGGRPMLEVECSACGHSKQIDLAEVVWPREDQVHKLPLRCDQCDRRKPNFMRLEPRIPDAPQPAAASGRLDV